MKGKTVDLRDLYRFVILFSVKNEISINHLKLQKVLYYIQSWHMVYFEENPLFSETPEAWVNGPVYRTVYNDLKDLKVYNNLGLIESFKENIEVEFDRLKTKLDLEKEQWEFLNAIFNHYGLMSHEKLVFMTHSDEPWNSARKGLGAFEYSDRKISLDEMHKFYKQRLESKKSQNGL